MLNNDSEFNAWKSNIDKQYPSGLDHFNPRVPKAYPVLVLYYMYEIEIDAHFAPIKQCGFDYVYPAEFDTSITSVQEHPELIIEGRLCNVRIPERLCDKYNVFGNEWLPAKIVAVINEAGSNYPTVVVDVRKSKKYATDAIHELRLKPSEVETHLMYRDIKQNS